MWPKMSDSYTPVAGSLVASISHNLDPDNERMGTASSSASSRGGYDEHGSYLDARVGTGALWVSSGNLLIDGMSFPVGLSAGYAVTKDLVLFGDFFDVHMVQPSSTNSYLHLSALDLYGAGLGVRYYLEPKSFFVSGAVLASRLTYDGTSDAIVNDSAFSETSHWGGIARFSVGKEWAVSSDWTVGIAGELLLGRMGQGDSSNGDGSYVPKGFSLLVAGSYHSPMKRESDGSEGTGTPPIPPIGYHTHDGLYLNASLGLGWLWVKSGDNTYAASVPELSGRGQPSSLAVGFAFAHSLVLFGEIYEMQVRHPSGDPDLSDLEWQGFGPGLKYYLMPANVFVASSVLVSQLTIHNSESGDSRYGINRHSQWGIMGRFSLGKEFWASGNWGLGVAGEALFGRLGGTNGWGSYSIKGLSLLASASFN
jgi:hypothetical protein